MARRSTAFATSRCGRQERRPILFGADSWPPDVPTPQGWIEFDVEDVAAASAVLKRRGYTLLVDSREEPWGQTVTRLLSPEGLLVGLTYTPWLR